MSEILDKDATESMNHVELPSEETGAELRTAPTSGSVAIHHQVDDPSDPWNWPTWKKHVNLFLVSFHAMLAGGSASSIIPCFVDFSKDLHISITQASYLTSTQILIFGLAPLAWRPVSARFGRRGVWLISTFVTALSNIGGAKCTTYGTMMVSRIISSFFVSPPLGLGAAFISEIYHPEGRGQKIGIWTLALITGIPLGPFVMGFVAEHLGWEWVYWLIAIIAGALFFMYLIFAEETVRPLDPSGAVMKNAPQPRIFQRLVPRPFSLSEIYEPFQLVTCPAVLIPLISHTLVFTFATILMTIEVPSLFAPKFHFHAQQIGLQFLGMIIGSVLGEQLSGPLGDYWMKRKSRRLGSWPAPEHRLWMTYLGFICIHVGLAVFCVRLYQAPPLHWNVTPVVGMGITAFGQQITATNSITYAVDSCANHSASVGVLINCVRCVFGFIASFWLPYMLENAGLLGSLGIMEGVLFVFSVTPIVAIHIRGARKTSPTTNGHSTTPDCVPQIQRV